MRVTKPRVATPDAATRTKRRRSSQLAGVREAVSGGASAASVQLQDEVGKDVRGKLVSDSKFSTQISTQESLAMKASLALPWNKLRIMRRYTICTCTEQMVHIYCALFRWFKAHGITIPSEKRKRKMSQELLLDNLQSESAPFSFALKHGGEDLRPSPLVYMPDLVAFVLHLLDQNAR